MSLHVRCPVWFKPGSNGGGSEGIAGGRGLGGGTSADDPGVEVGGADVKEPERVMHPQR